MPRKKKETVKKPEVDPNVFGLRAETVEQPITETLETNYMPYAMSVIVSRAIPEIDGFKPSHRKLLYTMYKMGLLRGDRTKSANIVGQTMKLNPHGDQAIYDTMVRLSKGYEALLTPFVDSKGNFGKMYSRDMSYAAPRYTEAKLSAISSELFRDIDSDTVEFVDNYDGSMKEPVLLPTTFPNVLVSANLGIAVGMASQICGFNLNEVCEAAIGRIKDPDFNVLSVMPAPDFPSGAEIIYDYTEMENIYRTGHGSFKVRARWRYLKKENIIEIYEIPYTTTTEAIMDKVAELIKTGKVREINDMRDETDLGGLKLAMDLKRGTDPDKLMQKLFKMTPLQDSFPCNFNILIAGNPKVMGVYEILDEWTAWRVDCVRRRVYHELKQKKDKLHLLKGLQKILLDIDKAIEIIRKTEKEADVVPNLMMGFGIDEIQAEFVAEIKLRNINREYILKKTSETEQLEKDIADLEETVKSKAKINRIIINELKEINKKYEMPRKTGIVYADEIEEFNEEESVPSYHVNVFVSREGYIKKITDLSLRMSGEHKYKEGDSLQTQFDCDNTEEILIFTDKQNLYKAKLADFNDTKASTLGTYIPAQVGMDEDEHVFAVLPANKYRENLILIFENGKAARFKMDVYETKTNRKRLINAYSDKSPLIKVLPFTDETDIVLFSDHGRALIVHTSVIPAKTSRSTQGVFCMKFGRGKHMVTDAALLKDTDIKNVSRYRSRTIPAMGALIKEDDRGEEQMSLLD